MSVAGILAFLSKSKIAKASIIIFLIIVAFGAFAITIAVKNKAISEKETELQEYKQELENLELINEALKKQLKYDKEEAVVLKGFDNSKEQTKKVEREALTRTDNEAINSISNDYYYYYKRYGLSNSDKVYKSSFDKTARKILYSADYGQKRFNRSVSRKRNENIAMAGLVQYSSGNELFSVFWRSVNNNTDERILSKRLKNNGDIAIAIVSIYSINILLKFFYLFYA